MNKKIIIAFALTVSILAGCQSSFKTSDRNPAQSSQGTGEIGSVDQSIKTLTPAEIRKSLKGNQASINNENLSIAVAKYDNAVRGLRHFCNEVRPEQKVDMSSKVEMEKFKRARTAINSLTDATDGLKDYAKTSDEISEYNNFLIETFYNVTAPMGTWGSPTWQAAMHPLCQAVK